MGSPEMHAGPEEPAAGILRFRTRFGAEDDLVRSFAQLVDRDHLFIASRSTFTVGLRRQFSLELRDGRSVLQGEGEVVESPARLAGPDSPSGLRFRMLRLTADSVEFHARLLRYKELLEEEEDTMVTDRSDSSLFETMAAAGRFGVVPANPLSELSDEALDELIECVIHEDVPARTATPSPRLAHTVPPPPEEDDRVDAAVEAIDDAPVHAAIPLSAQYARFSPESIGMPVRMATENPAPGRSRSPTFPGTGPFPFRETGPISFHETGSIPFGDNGVPYRETGPIPYRESGAFPYRETGPFPFRETSAHPSYNSIATGWSRPPVFVSVGAAGQALTALLALGLGFFGGYLVFHQSDSGAPPPASAAAARAPDAVAAAAPAPALASAAPATAAPAAAPAPAASPVPAQPAPAQPAPAQPAPASSAAAQVAPQAPASTAPPTEDPPPAAPTAAAAASRPKECLLSLIVRPSPARVLLDGRTIADGSGDVAVPCAGGTLTVKASGYRPFSKVLRPSPDRPAKLSVSLSRAEAAPSPRQLVIESTPPGAILTIDGSVVGRSPFRGSVPARSAFITATLNGYKVWSKRVHLGEGTTTVSASLDQIGDETTPAPSASASP